MIIVVVDSGKVPKVQQISEGIIWPDSSPFSLPLKVNSSLTHLDWDRAFFYRRCLIQKDSGCVRVWANEPLSAVIAASAWRKEIDCCPRSIVALMKRTGWDTSIVLGVSNNTSIKFD